MQGMADKEHCRQSLNRWDDAPMGQDTNCASKWLLNCQIDNEKGKWSCHSAKATSPSQAS